MGGGIRVSTQNVSNAAWPLRPAPALPDGFPCRLVVLVTGSDEGYRDAGVDQELRAITAGRHRGASVLSSSLIGGVVGRDDEEAVLVRQVVVRQGLHVQPGAVRSDFNFTGH